VSKKKLVPRTEAVAEGLLTDNEALAPEGGFTSTRTLPACRLKLSVSVPAASLISVRVRRVMGFTVITALPTSSRAMLLKPVDIIVSALTCAPAVAGTKFAAPAGFSSTVPLSSFITPLWAKAPRLSPTSKAVNITFFISSSGNR
jgi:hypothetical protein